MENNLDGKDLSKNKSLRKPVFSDILTAELLVEERTHCCFGKWFIEVDQLMSLFLELLYLDYEQPDILTPAGFFWSRTFEIFYNAHFAFRSCIILMERGFYNDSLNCCRSIIESLVKCKYFFKYTDKFEAHEKNEKGKHISFRMMWDDIVGKGAYEKIYVFMSKIEHKNCGTSTYKLNLMLNVTEQIYLLPAFNQKLAEVVINYLLYAFYGYLNLAPKFLHYKIESNLDFAKRYDYKMVYLDKLLQKHKEQFPAKKEWCMFMENIVR